MCHRLRESREAWENEYRQKGQIWKGAPPILPDLPSGSQVLELGCGNGKTLSAMLKRPWQLTALDFSSRAVNLSRNMAATTSGSPDFVVGDSASLPFKDGAFDAVFAFHITGHLIEDRRQRMASEVARVLDREGRLFFLEFEQEDMRAGKGEMVEPFTFMRGDGILTHYFSREEVAELFRVLQPVSVDSQRRTLRIRGQDLLRSEIVAIFVKGEQRDFRL